MKVFIQYMAVGGAGCLGAMARYGVASLCGRFFGTEFPVGTFLINISGSFFLGLFLTLIGNRLVVSDTTRLAIAVGFTGAYTTFSTLMFESQLLIKDGAVLKAMFNLFGSLIIGMLAVWLGIIVAQKI